MVGSAAVAALFSWLYHKTGRAWLLAFTGCAVMLFTVLLLRLILASRGTAQATPPQNTYKKKSRYVTPAEYEFRQVLRSLLGGRYEVCVQAPLVSVIEKTSGGAFRNELFRVADYVVIDSVTTEPLLLIELNDASHARADRAARDRKVADICAAARIPLATFTTAEAKDIDFVRRTLHKLLR